MTDVSPAARALEAAAQRAKTAPTKRERDRATVEVIERLAPLKRKHAHLVAARTGLDLDDAMADWTEALLGALHRWDPARGVVFVVFLGACLRWWPAEMARRYGHMQHEVPVDEVYPHAEPSWSPTESLDRLFDIEAVLDQLDAADRRELISEVRDSETRRDPAARKRLSRARRRARVTDAT